MFILLSICLAGISRKVKQEQEEISCNYIPTLFLPFFYFQLSNRSRTWTQVLFSAVVFLSVEFDSITEAGAPAAHLIRKRDLMMIPRKEKEGIFAALPISQLGGGFRYDEFCSNLVPRLLIIDGRNLKRKCVSETDPMSLVRPFAALCPVAHPPSGRI